MHGAHAIRPAQVDGTSTNLVEGREPWGAADEPMPRMFDYLNDADGDSIILGPGPALNNGNYGAPGTVIDTDPRTIFDLIVDMSFNNPAATVAALTFAGFEIRTVYSLGARVNITPRAPLTAMGYSIKGRRSAEPKMS
jgi:hypothetical protein